MKIYDTTKPNVIESTKYGIQVANLNEELSKSIIVFYGTQEFKKEDDRLVAVEPLTVNILSGLYVLLSSLPKDLQEKIKEHIKNGEDNA